MNGEIIFPKISVSERFTSNVMIIIFDIFRLYGLGLKMKYRLKQN